MMCKPELGRFYPVVSYVNWCFDYLIKIGCFNKLVLGIVLFKLLSHFDVVGDVIFLQNGR